MLTSCVRYQDGIRRVLAGSPSFDTPCYTTSRINEQMKAMKENPNGGIGCSTVYMGRYSINLHRENL
jgi:hypothetical protein